MSYYITMNSRSVPGVSLFLVNRDKVKHKWWTTSLNEAMQFFEEKAAKSSLSRLRFGNPEIISKEDAQILEEENEVIENQDHPFDIEK